MVIKKYKGIIPTLVVAVMIITACAGVPVAGAQNNGNPSGNSESVSAYAQKLYDTRNQYVGDASADGALLEALGITENLGVYTFELETEKEPCVLRIIFADEVTDTIVLDSAMNRNAILLLALIDNASEIQWQYTNADQAAGDRKVTAGLTRDDADALLDGDVKSYGQSASQVQSLLDLLDANNPDLNGSPAGSGTPAADSSSSVDRTNLDACIADAILSENTGRYFEGDFKTEAHKVLKTVESGNTTTVYAMALYLEFSYTDDGLSETSGSHMPVAITFEKNSNGEYDLKEYWMPQDGTYYAPSIQEKFPSEIYADALDTQKYIRAEMQDCYAKAIEHGRVDTDAALAKFVETIASSPAEASNPAAYIDAHPFEYRELLYYGDYTLRYAYTEFLKGGQTDLEGQILLSTMRELLGSEDVQSIMAGTAQEWFDEWKDQAVRLRDANSMAFMKENYPKTAMLLQMLAE